MSITQVFNLFKKPYKVEATDAEKKLLNNYFNFEMDDPWIKYRKLYPNTYDFIITQCAYEDLLLKCPNRNQRRQLMRDILKEKKKLLKK